MSSAAVIADWERSIREVQAAFADVLRATVAKTVAATVQTPHDLEVASRLWSVAKAEQHRHREQIDARWLQVLDLLSDQAVGADFTQREGAKRDLGGLELEIAYERAARTAMAEAAQRLLACGKDPAHLQSAAHLIADAAALEPWEKMTRASQAMTSERNRKDVPLEVLEQFADASLRYHKLRLGTEASFLPLLVPHVETKVAGQMESVMRQLKVFWQWKAAHP